MTKRRIALVVIVLIVAIGLIAMRFKPASGENSSIETASAQKKTLTENVDSSGKTKTSNEVNLSFQTGGLLSWVGVKEGDSVQAGQAIASLDTQALRKQVEKELRDYSQERNDFDQDKYTSYKDSLFTDTVKRVLEKNQWDLEKAVLDVELSTISLRFATLTTPIAGIVTRLDFPVAGVNVPLTAVATVSDPDSLVFTANIDEIDVGKISEGARAEVHLDAFPERVFAGTVKKIAFAAETSSAGATVFPVELSLFDGLSLRSGLNGDVTIHIRDYPSVVVVPEDAVKQQDDTQYVVVKKGETYEKRTVEIGITADGLVHIQKGLNEKEVVVTKGFDQLPESLDVN